MNQVRVLLADDHDLIRAGIANALRELPSLTVVAEVGDGIALRQALSQVQPDLLLIDVTMPDFEPLSTIRHIKTNKPDLKILVISAYDDDIYVQGLLGAGVDGYHLKDQPLSDLRLAVQRVLAGEKWVSSRLVSKLVNSTNAAPLPTSLTARQRDMLHCLQRGLDNQTIARRMGLSIKTVENHLTRLYRHLHVQSRLEAVNYVSQHPEVLGLPGQVAAQEVVGIEAATSDQVTILLVDDNARYRSQLRRTVGKICPQAFIYEAEDIATAVRLAQRVEPRLALVDVVLGDEDGISCTRRIKAISPASRIVLISAYPDREFHRLGLEAGAVAFLDKKDLDANVLRQVIDDVIG
ncbi:MAG TPA: response regulator [Anaerolineae bacterium]|nr:response regulator [Anaerolineae bacterium]